MTTPTRRSVPYVCRHCDEPISQPYSTTWVTTSEPPRADCLARPIPAFRYGPHEPALAVVES